MMQGPTKPPADQQNLLLFLSAHFLYYVIVNSGKITARDMGFRLEFQKDGKKYALDATTDNGTVSVKVKNATNHDLLSLQVS